ncbi:MAG: hypothetical protein FH753_00320 [Firmicutes bacterium]|nr:hypothetical protein [Bacillota bacterium]
MKTLSKTAMFLCFIFIIFLSYIFFTNYTSNEKITLSCEQGDFTFNKSAIPEIDKYLKNSENPQLEIENMELYYITKIKDSKYYILSFGCGMKLSDSLLIKQNNNINPTLLSKASIYQGFKSSPNLKHIAFLFGRNEGNKVIRNDLVIIDSSNLQNNKINNFKSFNWPINEFEWISNETIEITIPALNKFSFNNIKKWNFNNQKDTKKIKLKVFN